MIVYPVLGVGILMKFVAALFVLSCILLILLVLIQKGRGGGLSASFGGGGANTLLGSKTGDFLTWATIALVALFLLLAVFTAKFYKPTVSDYDADPNMGQNAPAVQAPADAPAAPETTTPESPVVAPVVDANSAGN